MKIQKIKAKNRVNKAIFLFSIIFVILCCCKKNSFANEISIYSKQPHNFVPTTDKLSGTDATSDASESSATASTITESETEKKAVPPELTAPNATVIGATISFISALLGACISFLSTMYIQNMQRKNAREERKTAYEQDIVNKKREAYYNYLNINKELYNYLVKSGEDDEEYAQLLNKLNEAFIWIEIYGNTQIVDCVNEMNKYLHSDTDDPEEYLNAYKQYIDLIKGDLRIDLL